MIDQTEAFGLALESLDSSRLLHEKRQNVAAKLGEFERISRECCQQLAKVKTFLSQVRGIYVDFVNGMSDDERDRIDGVVSDALGEIESSVRQLEVLSSTQAKSENAREHQKGVTMLLLESIRGIQETANGWRLLRQKHVLNSREKLCSVVTTNEKMAIVDQNALHEISQLDEEERLMLEQENQKLEEDLSNVLEEAKRIERHANEVSSLLTVFSEEVAHQHHVIIALHDDAAKNVDTISHVPQELKRAAEHGESFRKFMLIFLFSSGFFLLFIDWIN
jgi:hypothetical protein